jgi:hypothetical protein
MKKNEPKAKNLNKRFDAVDMKNQIQADLYSETKHLDGQELIEFYRRKAKEGPFKKRVA